MRISVVGCGMVGQSFALWLDENTSHTVLKRDPKYELNDSFEGVEAVFICIPVPTREDNTQDQTVLEKVVSEIKTECPFASIYIRSTVLPGTSDRLGVNHVPEFLSERTCIEDMKRLDIVGGVSRTDAVAIERLMAVFPGKKIHWMEPKEAELAKYTHNVFAAVKVNYFNLIYELCHKLDANYARVLDGARVTGFIEPTHTMVPGPDGKRGFGGGCLPKDLDAFKRFLGEQRIDRLSIVAAACENYQIRAGDEWVTS